MADYFRQLFRIKAYWITLSFILCFSTVVLAGTGSEKIILLRHSTGGNLFEQGGVKSWFSDYNSKNGTSYDISMRAYPDTPYNWKNYPYDYWNLWVNPSGPAKSGSSGVDTLSNLAKNYNVIIFKHCFPGADVQADSGSASASSSVKSLQNYKLQYRALREKFDALPNNIFIVWTLAPRHRLFTSQANAARAKQFVDWVKNDWLTEDNQSHPNIFVFDFWGQVAETSSNPSNGQVNTLKYAYERSHSDSDSHPNTTANRTVGPIFAQRVVDIISSFSSSGSGSTGSSLEAPGNLHIVSTP